MRSGPARRALPLLLPLLLAFALAFVPAASTHGDGDPRVDPIGGIQWNDRIQDVLSKMEKLSDAGKVEVAVTFRDRVSPAPYGVRTVAAGNEREMEEAVSAIVRDYLAERDSTRQRGDDRLHRAFHLHVLGVLFDKEGKRKGFLDAEVRLTARKASLSGAPFDLAATFQAHPGAGLTERYVLPASGTDYVLPVVLTKVALSGRSAAVRRKIPELEESLRKRYDALRKTNAAGAPVRVDARKVSVSWAQDGPDGFSVLYDAERHWTDGLDAAYKEHMATVEGRSKRCHAKRAVDA